MPPNPSVPVADRGHTALRARLRTSRREPEVQAQPELVADGYAPRPAEAPAPLPKPAPAPPPLFRDRQRCPPGAAKPAVAIPAVIPIVRPPDDPGVDEADDYRDEFAELNAGQQQGGWRGFLRRWGG